MRLLDEKFPEPITSALRTQKRGQMLVYVGEPECEEPFQFRVDTDGRMATTGSTMWKHFTSKTKLKINELISVIIFKASTRLIVSVDKL